MLKLPSVILRPGEERELSIRWKTTADTRARDRLVFSCTGYVQLIAQKRCRKNNQLYHELVQEGYLGLLHAVEKYDPHQFQNRFSTYALWWMRAYIHRYLKYMPRESSLNEPMGDDTDTTLQDLISDESFVQERLLGLHTEGDVQLLQQIATSTLHGNEWNVIKLRYFSGEDVTTLEEVGRHIVGHRGTHITREGVRIIETRAIRKLHSAFANWERMLEEKRHARAHHLPHHTEGLMGKIPEHVILACIEKISGADAHVSAVDIAKELSKEGEYREAATPFLIGQRLKYMVKNGLLIKHQSGSKRTYRVKNGHAVTSAPQTPRATSIAPARQHAPPALPHTREDRIFQVAIAMLKMGSEPSEDALHLSVGLRELSVALQKIPEKYRERAMQIAKKIIDT